MSLKGFFKKSSKPICKLISYKSTECLSEEQKPTIAIANTQSLNPSKKRKAQEYEENRGDRAFKHSWKDFHTWLAYDENVMWCEVCREFKHLLKKGNVKFVTGTDNFRKDAVDKHGSSFYHLRCMDAFKAKQNPLETPIAVAKRKLQTHQHEQLSSLFNSAYCIALQNWSFRDFAVLCELQQKNGLDMGDQYQNRHGIRTFIQSIAEVQRQVTINGIEQSRFISVKADGSTDRSVAEQESVFVRYVVKGVPVNKFIGMVELEQATSNGVLAALDKALYNFAGVSLETQKQKLINVNLDGAAVNMGIYNGVAAQLQRRNGDQVTVTHCINHGLELSIVDLRKDDPYIQIFESTLKVILI